jgi:hypothetical protein
VTDWENTSGAGTLPRCRRCKAIIVRPARDPCLVDLGGAVVSSCCGHQRPDLATVAFADGREALHGEAALSFFVEHGCGPVGSLDQRARNTT